jgi:hypothetical protein
MATPQRSIGSGFGAKSTDDVLDGLDLGGRLAVLTGGYSGLGLEATSSTWPTLRASVPSQTVSLTPDAAST